MHPRAGACDRDQQNHGEEEQGIRESAHRFLARYAWRVDCSLSFSAYVMKNAALLFILSLVGSPDAQTTASPVEPSASIRTEASASGIGAVEELLGAWRGEWQGAEGVTVPVDVVFTQGIRPRTVFAYVTFVDRKGERTVRRPALLTADGLALAVPGRAHVILRADGDARLIAPGLTLSRLRR
jgi:hypothetical protein